MRNEIRRLADYKMNFKRWPDFEIIFEDWVKLRPIHLKLKQFWAIQNCFGPLQKVWKDAK